VVLGNLERAREDLVSRMEAARRRGVPEPAATQPVAPLPMPPPARAGLAGLDLKELARRAAREAERKALLEVLEAVRWNRAAAARILKVSYKTLLSKLTACGTTPASPRRRPEGARPALRLTRSAGDFPHAAPQFLRVDRAPALRVHPGQ
jgi:DNA-binding NtrC family response regulator